MSFNETIDNIKSTLGEETAALVADDLLSLMSDYKTMEETSAEQAKTIDTLKVEKENLVSANSKLFQRIGVENNLVSSASNMIAETPEPEPVKISDLINDKGDLI